MYYTDNDFRLYHSAKGTTWKKHKYSAKKSNGGKVRYIYTSKDYQEDIDEAKKEETLAENEYKDARYRNVKNDEELNKHVYLYDDAYDTPEGAKRYMIEIDKAYNLPTYEHEKLRTSDFRSYSRNQELYDNSSATRQERAAAFQKLNAARNRRAVAEREYQNYLNSPLGKVESAVQTGREFISNLIKKR